MAKKVKIKPTNDGTGEQFSMPEIDADDDIDQICK